MIDTNSNPYFDSYNFENNFQKILFKPNFAIQARELNELQSIMRGQLKSLSDHIFKNGSKVSNCRTSVINRDYVRLMDFFTDTSTPVDLTSFNTGVYNVIGETTNVKAQLITTTNIVNGDPATLYVVYTQTGLDGIQATFLAGETLSIVDENEVIIKRVTVRCPGCVGSTLGNESPAIGKSVFFVIDEGVIYYDGMYVYVQRQEIVTEKYIPFDSSGNNISTAEYKIGLDVDQRIVDATEFPELNDNSLGYPNAAAPGADRYLTTAVLTQRTLSVEDGENFILLARIKAKQQIEYMKGDADYADIMNEIARGRYETNGDFTVTPFKTSFYEAKKANEDDPKGWSVNGDDKNLVAVISSGIGYVKGFRVETKMDSIVQFEKARDTEKTKSKTTFIPNHTYVTVRSIGNSVWVNENTSVSTIGNTEIKLYNGVVTSNDVSGSQIGVMKVIDQLKVAGSSDKYNLFVYDIQMLGNNTLSSVKSMKSQTGAFIAEAVLTNNKFEISEANNNTLLYPINVSNVSSLRSIDNSDNGSIILTVRKKLTANLDGSGTATFVAATDESFLGFNEQDYICWVGTYPSITVISLNSSMFNITGPTMTLALGSTHAGKTVYLTANVLKTNQVEKTKTYVYLTQQLTGAVNGSLNAVVPLGIADALDIVSLKLVDTNNISAEPIDVTNEYTLDNGQTDTFYGESKLIRSVVRSGIPASYRLLIQVGYFTHSGLSGFFTVDSYSQMLNDETFDKTYEDIPTFNSQNGTSYKLSDCIDFRPIKIGSNIDANALTPLLSSTAIFDLEFYLPRIDLLQIDKEGVLYVKKGISSQTPVKPNQDTDAMVLYEIHLNAYTYDLNDVRTKFIENKRYTMRDIGKLEDRIEKVEYYTTLSLLESNTINMDIKDTDGFSRFKNGIIVDSFKNYYSCDLEHPEFRACLDREEQELRPQYHSFNTKFDIDKSSSVNVKWYGNVGMITHNHEIACSNPYATKHISVNPYLVYKIVGTLLISPNVDTWSETEYLPNIVSNIDVGVDSLKKILDANQLMGTDWGTWTDLNKTTQSATNVTWDGLVRTTETTTTTSTAQQRVGVNTSIESRRDTYNVDDIVKDVEIIPYIRSKTIEFYGSRLKPNTVLHAFFDGVNVDKHCRMITQVLDDTTTRDYTMFGEKPLKTDENGQIRGEFRIPANKFFTGQKMFLLTASPIYKGDADQQVTIAKAKYFAGGIAQTKQSYTMNIVTPTIKQETVIENNVTTDISRDVSVVDFTPPPAPVPPVPAPTPTPAPEPVSEPEPIPDPIPIWNWVNTDPVAQGFTVDADSFVTKIDLYFQFIDQKSDQLWVEIRTTVNGYPSTTVLGRKEYSPAELNALGGVSDNSTQAVTVTFDTPIFVEANTMYVFVVGGYSPDTRIWVSKLGQKVVNIPGKVVENPPFQFTSFRSLNGVTWNSEQYETIKFQLYRAVFTQSRMSVVFKNSFNDNRSLKLDENPIEVAAGIQRVRIYAKNHGLTVSDRISISLLEDKPYLIQVVNSSPPQIGQKVTTTTGGGYVKDITKSNVGLNYYNLYLTETFGLMELNQQFTGEPYTKYMRDNYLLRANGNTTDYDSVQINQSIGYIKNNIRETFNTSTIGGVDYAALNKEHIVTEVDSEDTFIVNVSSVFTTSGKFGGSQAVLFEYNKKFNVLNISGEYQTYNADEGWTVDLIGHGNQNTLFAAANYNNLKQISFIPKQDIHLGQPAKLAGKNNSIRVLGTSKRSIEVTGTFVTTNKYISPIVNADSFSGTLVSNRIGNYKQSTYNVTPNATRWVDETGMGVQIYKYVTQNVLLQDAASELKVMFSVYKDINADFDVYVKVVTPTDTAANNDIPWKKLDLLQKNQSSSDLTQMIDYDCDVSELCSTWTEGTEFIAFRVKLVATSENSSKPPIFKNLRAIAVT